MTAGSSTAPARWRRSSCTPATSLLTSGTRYWPGATGVVVGVGEVAVAVGGAKEGAVGGAKEGGAGAGAGAGAGPGAGAELFPAG